ncbi:Ankyrin repeat-containing domain [Phytophthora cactorum]|nr:Ankyrin repeat-containing domain [Phytophthora cactorum]KAF1793258.1 Ankyrin repeat-containing domain [Phytophthora cactorum]
MWASFDTPPAKSFHVDFLAEAIYEPRDAFVYAASLNQVEVVRRWIEKKLNLNDLDKDGNHALYMAAQNESLEVLGLLLESGADVDQQQGDVWSGYSCWWVVFSNLKTIFASMTDRARLHCMPPGQASLHCACRNGHVDLVQLLLDSGVDPFVADDFGATPIDIARDWQRLDILDMLAAYRDTELLEANRERVKLLTEGLGNQVELPQGVRDIIIDYLC